MVQLTLTWQTILTAAAVLAALGALWKYAKKLFGWFDTQDNQTDEIGAIKKEQEILTFGVLACLKGLQEQGCDGPVTEAIAKIETYLNSKAHA